MPAVASSTISQKGSTSWDLDHDGNQRNSAVPRTAVIQRPSQPHTKVQAEVKDDWEDDDDDEEVEPAAQAEHNRRIWEAANAKAPAPMPSLIVSSSTVSPPIPLAAFQPTMRILKRPTSNASPSPSPTPAPNAESIKEREARYQAARDRIFGTSSPSTSAENTTSTQVDGASDSIQVKNDLKPSSPSPKSAVAIRQPRGPSSLIDNTAHSTGEPNQGDDGASIPKGFGERKRSLKPPLTGS
ncbi:hypothetical protein AX16_007657 [Volvariella volvacea WC 439]|nr:hypothetical protein AX16_007657 [Volvariella volvacea WC 439]